MGRRLFRLLVVLSVILVLGVVAVWVLTNTDFGRERVRKFALGALQGATHGIVKHLMPSETWQIIFAIFGGIAVGATAWVRVVSMLPAGPYNPGFARA